MNYIISKKLEKLALVVKNAYYFLLKAKTKIELDMLFMHERIHQNFPPAFIFFSYTSCTK